MHVPTSRVAQLQQYEERRLKEFEDALNKEAVSTYVVLLKPLIHLMLQVSSRSCPRHLFNCAHLRI